MFERIKFIKKEDLTITSIRTAILRRLFLVKNYFIFNLPWGFNANNRKKLKSFHNKHKGERCFIVANGPSLNEMDLDLLKDEVTIGMNRIYLMEELNGFKPTYLVCMDEQTQLAQFHKEFDTIEIPGFYNYSFIAKFSKKQNQHFFLQTTKIAFSKDFSRSCTNGASVCFTCIQLAYWMGFQQVYLIGKDHTYKSSSNLNKNKQYVVNTGDSTNHFAKAYYKPGQVWSAPRYDIEETAYKIARDVYEKDGRIIKDATVGGKLNVFEKVYYDTLFEKSQ